MVELPIINREASEDGPKQTFWRSYSDLENHPDFLALSENEFMPGITDPPSGASRRQFLQLMGASMAMAGLAACRRPVERIMPYTRRPEEIIPGISQYYATAMPFRGTVRGILVESHEGRPTKIEANPEYPTGPGGTSVFEQATILNLYDADRSQVVLRDGAVSTWQDFTQAISRLQVNPDVQRMAIIASPSSSPTEAMLRERLSERFPLLHWVTYRPEGKPASDIGTATVFGRTVRPVYRFDEAQVIVSLDADFLGATDVNSIANTSRFAASRRLNNPAASNLNRLYVIESSYTMTGGAADNRMAVRASDIAGVIQALAFELGVGGQSNAFSENAFVQALLGDLRNANGYGIVVAGETQPPEVHALAHAINEALGSTGNTVEYLEVDQSADTIAFEDLVELMSQGQVDAAVFLDVNPLYDAPAELDVAGALNQVGMSVHLGELVDETAQSCEWHIPKAHFLEAWGDGLSYIGTWTVIQPLIAPLYEEAKSSVELLGTLSAASSTSGYDLVREVWRTVLPDNFEDVWRKVLHDGFLPDSGYAVADVGADTGSIDVSFLEDGEMELVFRLDSTVLDGSFGNNAWMQELPDSATKLVWDNVALLSRRTADELGVEVLYSEGKFYADIVEVGVGGQSVELPVWILPGHPDNAITVNLGYGRAIRSNRSNRIERFFDTDDYSDVYGTGPVANGVGVNVGPLRSRSQEPVRKGAQVRKVGSGYLLVSTQEHGSMEGRPLVRMAPLSAYRENPDFAVEAVPSLKGRESWEDYPSLWEDNHPSDQPAIADNLYYKNQWGMVIDLNACTGCNACVVACNSENNIQVVGKEEVGRGREMAWLRIDRYFVSDEEEAEPRMALQPVPCMHCENAPCESVCPVAATVHSPDGLNEMVYNRCIGTRYCSNNCPYKVRRYNFFNWVKTLPDQVQMAQNPNVTVRFRGVMEKCTYCVQRIRSAQRTAELESRPVEDGDVTTACQQACPAQAIEFGDLNDPNSRVNVQRQNDRRYEMLAELSVKPRTSYLSRVYNPNPSLSQNEV